MPIIDTEIPSRLTHPGFSKGPVLHDMSPFNGEYIQEEEVYRLAKARVVFADHGLLQHDFPQLRDDALLATNPNLYKLSKEERQVAMAKTREDWLLEKVAYISQPQALQDKVNTAVQVDDVKVKAFRPYHYGRALIFSVGMVNKYLGGGRSETESGVLDVKGIGVRPGHKPTFDSHSNGLMALSEAFREVIFQRLVDFILVSNGMRCRTVPNYAVIDTGFDIRCAGDIPTGLLVRRAHRRPVYHWGLKEPHCREVGLERDVELLLRRYGVTTAGSDTILAFRLEKDKMTVKYGEHYLAYSPKAMEWIIELTRFNGQPLDFDGMNLQFTKQVSDKVPEPQIVDFGSFWYKDRFVDPVVSLVACRPVRLGEIIWPDSARFVPRDPEVAPPLKLWGRGRGVLGFHWDEKGNKGVVRDTQEMLALSLARHFRDGRLSGVQVNEKIDEYLATVPGFAAFYGRAH